MKLQRHIFTALVLLICGRTLAQEDSVLKYISTIRGSFSQFAIDGLDNVYLLTTSNQLKKLNAKGDSTGVFNDVRRFGRLTQLDVSNPLKTLLYYKNFSTIVILDRFMQVRNTVDLRKQGIFRVKAFANAYDNNMWVMDEQDYKLKKIDEQGKLLFETVDWRQLFDTMPSPSRIFDRDGFIYLYDTAKGFYIFDYYGAFKNKIILPGWQNTEVAGNTLYGISGNKLYSYQQNTLRLKEYSLPAFLGKYSALQVANGKVFVLTKEGLHIYKVK